jgi:cell division protein FtsZ
VPVEEVPVRRREPMAVEGVAPAAASGELAMDERPVPRPSGIDTSDLDIPAFLRRQSS